MMWTNLRRCLLNRPLCLRVDPISRGPGRNFSELSGYSYNGALLTLVAAIDLARTEVLKTHCCCKSFSPLSQLPTHCHCKSFIPPSRLNPVGNTVVRSISRPSRMNSCVQDTIKTVFSSSFFFFATLTSRRRVAEW